MSSPATQARFWDDISEKYAKSPIANQAAYETKLSKTQELFTPDSHVLEIGCGTGSTAVIHAPHVKHILATDLSEKMIEIARQRARDAGVENIEFAVTSAEDLQAEDASFDVILCLSLLHLLEDPLASLQRSYALLKPGGYVVSSTAALSQGLFHGLRLVLPIGLMLGKMPYVNMFSPARLLDWHRQAGFEIEHHWAPGAPAEFIIARKPE
ncbi:MAG: hypothetical protein Alpg2KO_17040 [Alphaproteobacteria bacterium]